MPLRSERGELYSFLLDLNADRYGAKKLAINAVANIQVCHRRLDHLHEQSLDVLRKQDGTTAVPHPRGLSRTATLALEGRLNSLLTPRQPATISTGLSSFLRGPDGALHVSRYRRLDVRQQGY